MSRVLYHEMHLLGNVLTVRPISGCLHLQFGDLKKHILFFWKYVFRVGKNYNSSY